MIYVVALSQVKPGQREAFIKEPRQCIAATRRKKAAFPMTATPAINDPNLFVVVERWESREDLKCPWPGADMKVWRIRGSRSRCRRA